MKNLYLLDDAIISPIGFSTSENLTSIKNETSGLKFHQNSRLRSGGSFAGIIDYQDLNLAFAEIGDIHLYTKLEKMMILAVHRVLVENPNLDLKKTALIVSTTKGNIDLLGKDHGFNKERVYLFELARKIKEFFKFSRAPVVVSNACISGGLALAVAKRLMLENINENAIVVGGDLVSDFVLTGFNSFQALSDKRCKPFSKNRNGINLGEAAAAVLVSSQKGTNLVNINMIGDATANDANHISGPSRTGEGLYKSIEKALQDANISSEKIDYISAHGTGTLYNDEMEAIAFHRSQFQGVPVNSFKSYYGHTLGASALVESILTKHSLLNDELYTSLNSKTSGVSKPLNVITRYKKQTLHYAMKTASGFGGCNLALIFKKEIND